MILTLIFLLLFGFTIFYALALAAAASPNPFQSLGDGVNKWRDDFDSDAIRSSHPTTAAMQVAGKNFAAVRRSILLKILTSPLLPTRITQKPVGPRLTGLLFCSGALRRMG